MDFRYMQDQQDLIDAAKAVFDGENTLERMRTIVAGEKVDDLWPQFAELGLIGVMAPEEIGGLGQDLDVMVGVAEAAGYSGLPEPLVDLAGISIPLLMVMGDTDKIKSALNGDVAIGLLSPLLNASNHAVHCDVFIRTSGSSGEIVDAAKVKFMARKSIDPLRTLSAVADNGEPSEMVDHHGAVLTAAQLVGLSKRLVDMSVEYAKERQQFGKPIGSFQAIKHHLASVHTQIEFTRPMVQLAALQGGRAVHTAKIAAIDTAMLAAETAIQVHGGMGYTFEVDLHLFMKRAWALCGEWGDRNYHMKKLEDMILDGDAELGPGTSFAA